MSKSFEYPTTINESCSTCPLRTPSARFVVEIYLKGEPALVEQTAVLISQGVPLEEIGDRHKAIAQIHEARDAIKDCAARIVDNKCELLTK